MAITVESLEVKITAEASQASSAIDGLANSFTNLKKSIEASIPSLTKISTVIKGIGKAVSKAKKITSSTKGGKGGGLTGAIEAVAGDEDKNSALIKRMKDLKKQVLTVSKEAGSNGMMKHYASTIDAVTGVTRTKQDNALRFTEDMFYENHPETPRIITDVSALTNGMKLGNWIDLNNQMRLCGKNASDLSEYVMSMPNIFTDSSVLTGGAKLSSWIDLNDKLRLSGKSAVESAKFFERMPEIFTDTSVLTGGEKLSNWMDLQEDLRISAKSAEESAKVFETFGKSIPVYNMGYDKDAMKWIDNYVGNTLDPTKKSKEVLDAFERQLNGRLPKSGMNLAGIVDMNTGVSPVAQRTDSGANSALEAAKAFFDADTIKAQVAENENLAKAAEKAAAANEKLAKSNDKVTKSSKSSSGSTRNFASNILRIAKNMAIRAAIRGIANAIKESVTNLYEWSKLQKDSNGKKFAEDLNGIKNATAQLKNQFAGIAGPLISAVAPAVTFVINAFTKMLEVISKVIAKITGQGFYYVANAIDAVGSSASSAGSAAKGMLAAFDELNVIGSQSGGGGGSGAGYGDMFSRVDLSEDGVIGGFENSVNTFEKLKEACEEFSSAIDSLTQNENFKSFLAMLADVTISTTLQVVVDTLGIIGDAIEGIDKLFDGDFLGSLESFASVFRDLTFDPWIQTVDTLTMTIDGLFGTDWNSKIKDFKEVWDWLGDLSWEEIWDLDVQAAEDFGKTIGKIFSDIVKDITEWWNNIDWKETSKAFGEWIGNAIIDATYFFQVEIPGFFNKLHDWFKNIDWEQLGNDILEWIVNAIIDATEFVQGIGEFAQKLWDDICDGIKDVIGSISDVADWCKENILDPFVEGLKKAFGINSPAKEMEEPGSYIGEGILQGIKKPFENIDSWIKENIFNPVKNFFSNNDVSVNANVSVNESADSKSSTILDRIKAIFGYNGKTSTPTSKLGGDKESKFSSIWGSIKGIFSFNGKKSTLTAETKQTGTAASTIQAAWEKIKSAVSGSKGTATMSVNMKTSSAFDTVKRFIENVWNKLVATKTVSMNATFSDKFSSAWNGFARKINSSWIARQVGISLPTFASGGIVDQGQLFIAREAGPELVGSMGGHTAVANNDQIVAGISSGVARANSEQNELLRQQNGILMQLLQKELVISPSAALGQVNARSAILYGRV